MHDILFENIAHTLVEAGGKPLGASLARRKRAVGLPSRFWTPGQNLRISFLGTPPEAFKIAVYDTACKWLAYANLTFEQVEDNDVTAEIRIEAIENNKVNASKIGNESLETTDASMRLGCRPGDALFECIVLHEFGHALGMKHEHQHPDAYIPWDMDKARERMKRIVTRARPDMDPGWLEQAIEEAISQNILPLEGDTWSRPYDKTSIMHYAVSQQSTVGDWELAQNTAISDEDKNFMRQVYPANWPDPRLGED